MGTMKRLGSVIMGAVLLTGMAACGASDSGGAKASAVVKFGTPGLPASLDPRLAGPNDTPYLEQVYERLITTSEDGEFEPGLATKWELKDDTFVLTLQKGVKFQDGATFDAAAVKANIDSAKAPTSNLRNTLADIKSVDVVSPQEVSLKLSAPGGHLIGTFASYAGMMISPKALSNPDLKSNPVGSGPFVVKSMDKTKVTYEKWDDYREADRVEIGGIQIISYLDTSTMLRAIRSGQIDGGSLNVQQFDEAKSAGLDVTSTPITVFAGILLNTSKKEFAIPEVRQALMHAIDRKGIVDGIYGGQATVTHQPYPEGYWAYDEKLVDPPEAKYDVAKAKQLLADAGLSNGFTFELAGGTQPLYQAIAQAIQAQLAEVGITVKVKSATTLVKERASGDFEAIIGTMQSGFPDPTVFVREYYLPGGIFNHGKFEIPDGQALLDESRSSVDTSVRAVPLAKALEAAVTAGPPVIPIAMHRRVIALRKNVSGLGKTILSDLDFSTVKVK